MSQFFFKDKNLVPENIRKGVKIGKVKGTLEGGGGGADPVNRNITANSSTLEQVFTPGSDYDGIGIFTLLPYVLQSKTVSSSTSSQTVTPDQGYDGLSSVTVSPYVLDNKTVDSSTATQTITSDVDGLNSVTVNPYTLDSKSLNPSTVSQTVNSSADGLSSVSISAVTSSIDNNIQAGNIKNGVTILGITGNLMSGDWVSGVRKGTITDLRTRTLTAGVRQYGYYNLFNNISQLNRYLPIITGANTSVGEFKSTFANTKYWKWPTTFDASTIGWEIPFESIGSNGMESFFEGAQFETQTGIETKVLFSNLTSVDTNGLKYAFKNAHGALTFSFPSLTSIGNYAMQEAFYNTGITSVDMSALEYLNGNWCIFDCFKNSSYLASADLSSLISINGDRPCCGVFYGCSSLTSFDLSDLTSITGEAAAYSMFENCTSLTTISFPSLTTINGTTVLGDTFRGCSGLTTINFPSLSSMYGSYCVYRTFENCSNIVTATVHPGSIIESNNNNNLLGYVTSLTNLTLSADATNNIVLRWQPNLTAASVLSVLTHLDSNTSGKSCTFYSGGLTVTDDAQGSIQAAYDDAVNAGWTINNLTITPYSA